MGQKKVMQIQPCADAQGVWLWKDFSHWEIMEVDTMKKEYEHPKAVLVEYSYDTNVVAKSATCSGSHYVFQTTSGCNQYKWTDYQKTISAGHPCDWDTSDYPFAR